MQTVAEIEARVRSKIRFSVVRSPSKLSHCQARTKRSTDLRVTAKAASHEVLRLSMARGMHGNPFWQVGLRALFPGFVINMIELAREGCGWMKYVCQDSKPPIPCGSI